MEERTERAPCRDAYAPLRNKEEQIALPGLEHMERKVDSRAALLAAKVAQRYANAPSYSDVLAAEARARAEAAAVAPSASVDTHFAPQPSTENWNRPLSTEEEDAFDSPDVLEEEPAFEAVEPLAVESYRVSAGAGCGTQSPSPARGGSAA